MNGDEKYARKFLDKDNLELNEKTLILVDGYDEV